MIWVSKWQRVCVQVPFFVKQRQCRFMHCLSIARLIARNGVQWGGEGDLLGHVCHCGVLLDISHFVAYPGM